MPAWMTSELRELVPVPIPSADSRMMTSRPARASARATARPTTPAPITTQSTVSNGDELMGVMLEPAVLLVTKERLQNEGRLGHRGRHADRPRFGARAGGGRFLRLRAS